MVHFVVHCIVRTAHAGKALSIANKVWMQLVNK